jgi:hypothetical protein
MTNKPSQTYVKLSKTYAIGTKKLKIKIKITTHMDL